MEFADHDPIFRRYAGRFGAAARRAVRSRRPAIAAIATLALLLVGLLVYEFDARDRGTDDAYVTGHLHVISRAWPAPSSACSSTTTSSCMPATRSCRSTGVISTCGSPRSGHASPRRMPMRAAHTR